MKKKPRLQRSDSVWLFAVCLLVLLQFWWLPGDPGTPDDSYSSTIEGKRGFFQTLEGLSQAGLLPPVRREASRLVPHDPCTLLILSPDRYPDEHEQEALRQFVSRGGTLLFAPNWEHPDVSMPGLNIRTEQTYFREEDTIYTRVVPADQSVPMPVPPASSSDASTPADELMAEAESETSEDDANTGMTSAPAVSTSPSGTTVPPVVNQQPPPRRKPTEEIIDQTIRNNPGLQPQTPPLADIENPEEMPVSDLQAESQLVKGHVVWRTRAKMNMNRTDSTVLVKSTSGTVQAASWKFNNGLLLLSASSDVFSNRAMLYPAQAELAIRLIEHAHAHHERNGITNQTPIVVSEFLNASDSYRGPAVLMTPALRSGTLQLITIAILAGWFGFHRFGPPNRNDSTQRRSLKESAAAIGNLHFRTNSGGEAVQGYLEYMRTQLQRLFGRSIRLNDFTVIATRTGLHSDDVRRRIENATRLGVLSSTSTAHAAVAIRDLSDILSRLQGTRSSKH